jgi:hypothetical protein
LGTKSADVRVDHGKSQLNHEVIFL